MKFCYLKLIYLVKMNANHVKPLYLNFIKEYWLYQVNVNILRLHSGHKFGQNKWFIKHGIQTWEYRLLKDSETCKVTSF